jgi:hypothetical protein
MHLALNCIRMKIGESRNTPVPDSPLKSNNSRSTDPLLSHAKETVDTLELSTRKGVINQGSEKLERRENLHFIDKVELSTKRKPDNPAIERTKPVSAIPQERIDALLQAVRAETYNARAGFAVQGIAKSQLLNITV